MLVSYQPIVDIRTGKVVKAEAECRLSERRPGLDTADQILAYAEQNGLTKGLTSWLVEEAVGFWRNLGPNAPNGLSLRISIVNLREIDFADRVLETLKRDDLKPSRLWLQMDERLLDVRDAVSRDTMRRLTNAGVRLGLDGFGTDVSSVSHLEIGEFPLKEVTIDPVLFADMARNAKHRAAVKSIADIARNLNIELAAKGIELKKSLDRLAQVGVVRAQGPAIAPAMYGDAFADWLKYAPEPGRRLKIA